MFPTNGQFANITLVIWRGGGVIRQSWGKTLPLARKWAKRLHNPDHLGFPYSSQRGDNNNRGPQWGR